VDLQVRHILQHDEIHSKKTQICSSEWRLHAIDFDIANLRNFLLAYRVNYRLPPNAMSSAIGAISDVSQLDRRFSTSSKLASR